jgi:hypothetical protein
VDVLKVKVGVEAVIGLDHLFIEYGDGKDHGRQVTLHTRYVGLSKQIHVIQGAGAEKAEGIGLE